MPAKGALRCVILGGGGHARVVIDALRASEAAVPHAILDAEKRLWGTQVLDVPIRGGDELIEAVQAEGVSCFVIGVGGVGDNMPRQRLFDMAVRLGLKPLTVCHPSAVCSPAATLGAGTVVLPLAVVNAGAHLGRNVIVNTGAIIEHDCVVGDHVHVATGARLCGAVRVAQAAHIGAGATVRQGCVIGEAAVVGAHALVLETVPDRVVVGGVPAQRLEKLKTGKGAQFPQSRKVMT